MHYRPKKLCRWFKNDSNNFISCGQRRLLLVSWQTQQARTGFSRVETSSARSNEVANPPSDKDSCLNYLKPQTQQYLIMINAREVW